MDSFLTPVGVLMTILGLVIIIAGLLSMVRSMLMPLPRVTLAARGSRAVTEWIAWLFIARQKNFARQDSVLSGVGPVSVLVELVVLMLMFLVGFGLMIYGVSGMDFTDSLLQAGSTLFTLGLIERDNPGQVILNFFAAFMGVAIIAILIGYLFVLYSAYTQRESVVVRTSMRSGQPAWGPEIICRRHLSGESPLHSTKELVQWVSDVRNSQTIYPVLNFFRSYTPLRSWVITMLAMLDAAALRLVLLEDAEDEDVALVMEGSETFAALFRNMALRGRGFKRDPLPEGQLPAAELTAGQLALFRAVRTDRTRSERGNRTDGPTRAGHCNLPREEFDRAVALIRRAGVPIRSGAGGDESWESFKDIRATYEEAAIALAARLHVVRAPWSGERRGSLAVMWPTLVSEQLAAGGN
jgi:hypothetical protein